MSIQNYDGKYHDKIRQCSLDSGAAKKIIPALYTIRHLNPITAYTRR